MAAKSEDVYIRVHLDANNAEGEILSLEAAMEKLSKRKEQLEKRANHTTSDPEYQMIAREFALAQKLVAETRASVVKVEEVVSHLTSATTKEIKSAMTKVQRTINTLTRTGEDAAKLALAQEQMNTLKKEFDRRNAAAEPLQRRIKDLTKLTADELDRCVKESGKFVQSLPKGTQESRQMLSMYQRFREQQEKVNGQMSLGVASRLATGSKKGTLSQLAEAGKYLKQYKEDWGQFMNDTMGRKMDDRIQNITRRQLEMARSIANGSVKASYADMQTALQVIKQRWESLDPSVKKNKTLIHDLGLEYEKLRADISAWGSATMTKADAGNVLAQSLRLIKQGADADANAVAHYIEQLKLAESAEGLTIQNQNMLYSARKRLTDLQRTEVPLQSRGLSAILGDIDEAKSLAQLEELQKELTAFYKTAIVPSEIVESKERLDKLNETIRNFGMKEMPKRSLSEILGEIDKAESLAQLEKLRTELTDFYRNAVVPTEIAESKQRLDKLNETIKNFGVRETTARPLTDIFKDIDGAQSLSQLEKFRDELKSVFRDLTDQGEIKAARAKFEQLESAIKNFGTETVDAMAVVRDPKSYNLSQITAAIKQLEEKFNNIKADPTFDALRQKMAIDINTLKQYKEAAEAALKPFSMSNADAIGFAKGGNGTVAQLREAMKVLEEFREKSLQTNDTTQLAQYNKYIAGLKQRIDEATKSVTQMDVETAKWAANGAIPATVAELKEAKEVLEKFKQTLQTSDTAGLKQVNDDLKKIDETLDRVNGKTVSLSTKGYDDIVNGAKDMLKEIRENGTGSVSMAEYNKTIENLKRVQSAQNSTIYGSQQAVALEKELIELYKVKNPLLFDQARMDQAVADAEDILNLKERSNAATVRETIEAYKQMIEMDNISIAKKLELSETLKKLEAVYNGTSVTKGKEYDTGLRADDIIKEFSENKTVSAEAHEIQKLINDLKNLQKNRDFLPVGSYQKAGDRIKSLEKILKNADNAAKQLAYDEKFVADTLKNLNTAPAEDLEKAMLMCRNRMRDAQTSLTDYIKSAVQLKQMQRQVRGVTDEFKAQSDWLSTNVKKIGNYLGVFGGFYLVRQQFEQWFRASMKYDDQLVDIQKTTNMTTQAIHELADGIKRIDTRSSIESLQNLAYSAGKLGVKSVSEVMGFVRAADMLNVSLGEQLGDDAAERLMKVATVMGTTDAYGLEDALMRTGSAITELAKNSAASADPIVNFMARTAGLAKQSGITTAELAGLGAAVSALGQPVEMSATSFSKMMVQMEKSYKTVGAALKMTDKEMETMRLNLETGNGMDAFLDMLRRVKEMGGLSNTASIAKDLGSEGSRVIQTLSTLASSYDTIEKMVRQSTDAFEKNTTVLEEYRKKNNNTAALFERIKNAFAKMFVSPENVEWLNQLLVKLQVLPDAVQQLIDNFRTMGSIFGGFVVNHVYGLVNALSALFKVMMWKAALNGIVNLTMQTRSAIISFWSYVAAARAADTATKAFTFSIKGLQAAINPVFAVIGVVTTLWQVFANNEKEATKWNDTLNDSLDRTQRTASDTTYEMEGLLKKIQETETEEEKALGLRRQLGDMFGQYIGELDVEKAKYENLATAIRAANSELRAKQLYEATNQHVKELEEQAQKDQAPSYGAMVKAIRSRVNSGDAGIDEQIAIRAVNAMISDPKKFGLYLDKKSDGTYEANTYTTLGTTKREEAIQNAINKAISDAVEQSGYEGITPKKIELYRSDGNTTDSKDAYNNFVENFADLANNADGLNKAIESAKITGYGRAAVTAQEANKVLDPRMEAEWKKFESAITRGGAFDAANQTMKQRSGANTNDATADDWARDIRQLEKTKEGNELRNQYSRAVSFWLEDARNKYTNLDIQRGAIKDNKAEQDKITAQMKQLDIQIKNAEAFQKVVALPVKEAVDPNADKKAHREGQEEYKNIIAKIERLYEVEEQRQKDLFNNGGMTKFAYDQAMLEIEKQRNVSLGQARYAITGEDVGEVGWQKRMDEIDAAGIGGEIGKAIMAEIRKTSDLKTGGLNSIAKKLNAGSAEDRAVVSGIKKNADQNFSDAASVDVKRYEADLKAMLERNPIGKVTDQFLNQFQEMGIMFANLAVPADQMTEDVMENQRRLRAITNQVMAVYLDLGKQTNRFDVTTAEGLEAYRKYVSQLPLIGEEAAKQSDEKLRSLYYETYQYAETYSESVTRLIERQRKIWDKMFKQTRQHINSVARQADIERQMNGGTMNKFYETGVNAQLANARRDAEQADANDDIEAYNKAIDRVYKLEARVSDLKEKYEDTKDKLSTLLEEKEINVKLNIEDKELDGQIEKLQKKLGDLEEKLNGDGIHVSIKYGYSQLENFGGSKRMQLESDIELKREKYNDAMADWEFQQRNALNQQSAARQDYDNLKKKKEADPTSVTDSEMEVAYNALNEADTLMEQVSQMPDTVREAADAMTDAMLALSESTLAWASDMEQSFEKFMEGIVPFRSWYTDNGSLADNIFGTKEQRQEAFGAFMDDVKKAVRKSITEYVRLRVQKSVQDKMQTASEKMQEKIRSLFHKQTKAEEVATDVAAETTKQNVDKLTTQMHMQNSEQGKNKAIADKTTETSGTVLGNMAQAVSKAFADLGPIAGAVAAGVVSAAIGAVLTMAMNALGGSKKNTETSGAKVKLVSGMLTYDSGNVQSFSPVRTYNNGTGAQKRTINMLPVMGDDGRVYMVPEGDLMGENDMSSYTGIVSRPMLTSVGGAPALIGERGPEMVIGRETTRAMQMDNPELLRAIIEFDKNRSRGFAKTFDSGNLSDAVNSEQVTVNNAPAAPNGITAEQLEANTAVMAALLARLDQPIRAEFNMNGKGGAADQMAQGLLNSRRLGDLDSVKRLFGSR